MVHFKRCREGRKRRSLNWEFGFFIGVKGCLTQTSSKFLRSFEKLASPNEALGKAIRIRQSHPTRTIRVTYVYTVLDIFILVEQLSCNIICKYFLM